MADVTPLPCPDLSCAWVYFAGRDDPAVVAQHLTMHRDQPRRWLSCSGGCGLIDGPFQAATAFTCSGCCTQLVTASRTDKRPPDPVPDAKGGLTPT